MTKICISAVHESCCMRAFTLWFVTFFTSDTISAHPYIPIWNVKLHTCPTSFRSGTCGISHMFDLKMGSKCFFFAWFPSKVTNIGFEGLSCLCMHLHRSWSTFWTLKHKFHPWYMLRINLKSFLKNKIFIEISTPNSIFLRSKKIENFTSQTDFGDFFHFGCL